MRISDWSSDVCSSDLLGWSAGTGVQVPTGDNIVFSVERAFTDGPVAAESVARLNLLRPHLARSALVSARTQHKRAQGAAQAPPPPPLPAFFHRPRRVCGTSRTLGPERSSLTLEKG